MRGAPHRGFAAAIVLTRAAISALTGGRPPGPARTAGPVLADASPLPSEDGIRRDDDQRRLPAGPDSGQANPDQTVGRAELGARRESLVDGELLAQGQVLEGELAVAADEKGEEPE